MPDLTNNRNAARWNNTTYQHHIDAARDIAATGGHGWDAAVHALIALALIQKEQLEMQRSTVGGS